MQMLHYVHGTHTQSDQRGLFATHCAMATARIHWTLICMHLLRYIPRRAAKSNSLGLPHCYFFSLNLLHIRTYYPHTTRKTYLRKPWKNEKKKTQAAQRERMGTGQRKPACYSPFFCICAQTDG